MAIYDYPADSLIYYNIKKLFVHYKSSMSQLLEIMQDAKICGLPPGFAIIINDESCVVGVVTDGDIRESMLKGMNIDSSVGEFMTKDPVVISESVPPERVLKKIKEKIEKSGRICDIKYAILVDDYRRVLALIESTKLSSAYSYLSDKIAVIGLGYVGLTFAVSMAERGFEVLGYDTDESIRKALEVGKAHVYEVGLDALLKNTIEKESFKIIHNPKELGKAKAYVICVNTPTDNMKSDLSYLQSAILALCDLIKNGDLIIIRCTVPVGTCRNIVKEIIETNTDFHVGREIGLVFAPERTIEGQALKELKSLPQVIGGINDFSTEAASRIFTKLSPTIIRVENLEEAEFVKLINNSFRDISFGFANEIALTCSDYNLDSHTIINAANSGYPRNNIPLPSPGVGGLCLTKDSYLFINSKKSNHHQSIAEVGRQINEQIPQRIADKILVSLEESGKEINDCSVFIVGFAYKGDPETNDIRESPTIDIVRCLKKKLKQIYGYDSVVDKNIIENLGVPYKKIEDGFEDSDAVLFVNNHRSYAELDIYYLIKKMNRPALLFDGWSIFDKKEIEKTHGIRYMGLGYLTPFEKV